MISLGRKKSIEAQENFPGILSSETAKEAGRARRTNPISFSELASAKRGGKLGRRRSTLSLKCEEFSSTATNDSSPVPFLVYTKERIATCERFCQIVRDFALSHNEEASNKLRLSFRVSHHSRKRVTKRQCSRHRFPAFHDSRRCLRIYC